MSEDETRAGGGEVVVEAPARSSLQMLAKRLVQALVTVLVAPRLAAYRVGRAVLGDRAFGAASESIARIPGMRGVYWRQAFYRATLSRCGQDVYIGWQSVFSMHQAEVGDNAYVGRRCSLGYAAVGAHAMLADGVQVLSGGREHGRGGDGETHQDRPQVYQRVRIGAGAWIGTNAVIMADVGDHAIVGAGAVVTRAVPANAVAVGVPARVVKTL